MSLRADNVAPAYMAEQTLFGTADPRQCGGVSMLPPASHLEAKKRFPDGGNQPVPWVIPRSSES